MTATAVSSGQRVSSSGWPDRKKPTASYSRRSRSAGSHGSICGSIDRSALAAAPNNSFCRRPRFMRMLGAPSTVSTRQKTRARFPSKSSKGAGGGKASARAC